MRAKELLLAKRQASRLKEIKRAANYSAKRKVETESRNSEQNWTSLLEEWNAQVKPKDRARLTGRNGEKNRCEEEAEQYSTGVTRTKKKIEDAKQEIGRSKDVEALLAVTLSDLVVLQDEFERITVVGDAAKDEEELESVTKELGAAKNELESVTGAGLEFMSSMSVIRNELVLIAEEKARREKIEDEADSTARDLNSKLERAKSKLESVTRAEEKAKGMASELMLGLEQQRTEAEAAKKENELVNGRIAAVRMAIEKMDGETDAAEESLEAAAAELELVQASEAAALEHLKTLIESASRERASANQKRTCVTISRFEYDYLREQATGAKGVADKRVAAARAWVEALEASRREIVTRAKMARREVWDLRIEEEQHVFAMEMSLSAKKQAEGELRRALSVKRRVEGEMKCRRSFSAKRRVAGESRLRKNPVGDKVRLTPPR